ncbi:hypothetical protein ABKV19_013130 [Rosa sericea]
MASSSSTPHLSFSRPQSHTHQNRKNPIPNLPSLALFLISLSNSDHPWCCLVNNSRTFHKLWKKATH